MEISLNVAFPQLCDLDASSLLRFQTFDWDAPDAAKLSAIVAIGQALIDPDMSRALVWFTAFLEDSREPSLSLTDRVLQDRLMLARFAAATPVAVYYDASGRWGEAYDFIHAAISFDYQVGRGRKRQEVQQSFFGFDLAEADSLLLRMYGEAAPKWIAATYHLAWVFGGLDQLTEDIADTAWRMIENPASEMDPWSILVGRVQMVTWAAKIQNYRGQDWAEKLLDQFQNSTDYDTRALIATLFTSDAYSYTSEASDVWARLVLNDFPQFEASETHTLKMLGVLVSTRRGWVENRERIFEEIEVLRARFRASTQSWEDFDEVLESRAGTLNQIIYFLSEYGETTDFLDLFRAWRGNDKDTNLDPNALIVLPTMSPGTRYIWPEGRWSAPDSNADTLNSVQFSMGAALGMFLRGPAGDVVPEALRNDRLDIPITDLSEAMEQALIKHFDPVGLKEQLPASWQPKSLITFGAQNKPVQSLLSRYALIEAPIEASFQEKTKGRTLRRLSIWEGNLLSGHFEIEMLKNVSAREEWDIEVSKAVAGKGHAQTLNSFREWYEDTTADVLWLISHGEYDPFASEGMRVEIGAGYWATLRDISTWKIPAEGRRLLVLNACNSATAQGRAGLPRIGLAQILAGSCQSVVGNLWPAEPGAASVFGSCLVKSLSELNIVDAPVQAVKSFQLKNARQHCVEVATEGMENEISDRFLGWADQGFPLTKTGAPTYVV